MGEEDEKRELPDLAEEVAQRRRQIRAMTEELTGAPASMYHVADPMVEAKLLDEIFDLLRHLGDGDPRSANPRDSLPEHDDNGISRDDIDNLMAWVDAMPPAVSAELFEGAGQEESWILASMALEASGKARTLALAHLGDIEQQLRAGVAIDEASLEALTHVLDAAEELPPEVAELHELVRCARAKENRE